MLNVRTGPVHPFRSATTLMVTTTGAAPAFTAAKLGISNGALLSLPSANPIAAPPLQLKFSLVAGKVFELKAIGPTVAPAQTVTLLIAATTGSGLMVIVKVCSLGTVVVQPFLVARNVMVPTIGTPVKLLGAV